MNKWTLQVVMNVVIGVDPHKASHTAVAIDEAEDEISSVKVRATRRQVEQLVRWAEPFEKRRWAIESAGGMGYLLAQQLVARGEEVLDVPATLASRIRVLSTGRSNKNDPNDAHSIAVAAYRARSLRSVEPAEHSEVLRLLAKRNVDLGSHRTRVVCRLHALLAELAPGGIAKEMYVSDGERFLANITPENPTEQVRHDLAVELLDDVRRLDEQTKESHRRIRMAIKASGTSLTEIYGVGPIIAAQLIGYAGDVRRFANRDAFASYNGTAPVEFASGGRVVHRVSQRGNRQLNHAVHMAAVTQIRNPATTGRLYFERKVAEGKTKKEALRSLKRQISNAVYRQLLLDACLGGPGGHPGTTPCLRDRLFTLRNRLFGEVTPEPRETLRRRALA
jgi:transposase